LDHVDIVSTISDRQRKGFGVSLDKFDDLRLVTRRGSEDDHCGNFIEYILDYARKLLVLKNCAQATSVDKDGEVLGFWLACRTSETGESSLQLERRLNVIGCVLFFNVNLVFWAWLQITVSDS
jgi:hypothetical protein